MKLRRNCGESADDVIYDFMIGIAIVMKYMYLVYVLFLF